MKTCRDCKKLLKDEEFYQNKKGFFHPNCKRCVCEKARQRRLDEPEKYRAQDRRKYQNKKPQALERMAKYRERRKNNPAWALMRKAHYAVSNSIAQGKLNRPQVCSDCGSLGRIEAHHEDYNYPLTVRWLCAPCHRRVHFQAPAAAPAAAGDSTEELF